VSTLDFVKRILVEECYVELADILPETDILEDLMIDSLDVLNAVFRVQKETGVNIPIDAWIEEKYGDEAPDQNRFLVSHICEFIDCERETKEPLS